jgi:hypothetical protein
MHKDRIRSQGISDATFLQAISRILDTEISPQLIFNRSKKEQLWIYQSVQVLSIRSGANVLYEIKNNVLAVCMHRELEPALQAVPQYEANESGYLIVTTKPVRQQRDLLSTID